LQASPVERENPRGHEKNRLVVAAAAAAAGLQYHTSSFLCLFLSSLPGNTCSRHSTF